MTFGQACGMYRINYVGEVKTELNDIKKIKLPTTMFLHNLEMDNSKLAFIEINLNDGEFDFETKSHLTSHLYSDAQKLKEYFQSKRKSIPIILISEKDGIVTEKKYAINWEQINMKMIDDDGFGILFQLNLGETARN